MLEKMQEQRISWPEFTGSEMTDLITKEAIRARNISEMAS
jgi:hypothetical protein